jgi:hypothetical protein
MGLLTRLLWFGGGKLSSQLRAALETEGVVLIEEELGGSLRYDHFKTPGRRFNGKITPERIALGISEKRFVVYGRAKLVDSAFSSPNLQATEITSDGDRLVILVDYDRLEVPKTSGQVRIGIDTPSAALIVDELRSRMA